MKAVSWWQCILVFEKLANMTVECLSWYVRVSHKVTPSYFHKASFFTLGLYFGLKLPPIAFWILKNKEVLVPTDFIMYSSWFTHCPFLSILFMLVKQRVMNCRNPKRILWRQEGEEKPIYWNLLREKTPKVTSTRCNDDGYYLSPLGEIVSAKSSIRY